MSFIWGWNYQHHSNKDTNVTCNPISLRKGGILALNTSYSLTLTENTLFWPPCNGTADLRDSSTIVGHHGPFYASTSPQLYAIAIATVLAYVLSIILFITPRTFFIGGRGGGFLGRHGMISGSYGSSSVIGVGGRPWLQKVAALTVAISLTIATADSFDVAKRQYDQGYMNSDELRREVVDGLELRIIRVISSTFLWLAQVQTLIRLFPRHKEKVVIKWVGFALISLDTIFSLLNNFIHTGNHIVHPGDFRDAIPALNYLFELSLSMLYAAWVIFYSLSKHRFAFFHIKMRNICLVALLSLVAVLIPVVFFILDVAKPNVAGWGEFIRWVGAAAASVVVWEWVERIEALEREDRKDGILGREIFDGDEMLDVTPSEEVGGPKPRRHQRHQGGSGGGSGLDSGWRGARPSSHRHLRSRIKFDTHLPQVHRWKRRKKDTNDQNESSHHIELVPPPLAATPISRADTISAASTVYRVRYHSVHSPRQSISEPLASEDVEKQLPPILAHEIDHNSGSRNTSGLYTLKPSKGWLSTINPFKRRRGSPPQEVATAQAEEGRAPTAMPAPEIVDEEAGNHHFKSRLGSFFNRNWNTASSEPRNSDPTALPVTVIPARGKRERATSESSSDSSSPRPRRADTNERKATETPLPVMVIPAQPRSPMAWSAQHGFEEPPHPLPTLRTISSPNRAFPGPDHSPDVTGTVSPAVDYQPTHQGQHHRSEVNGGNGDGRGPSLKPGPAPAPGQGDIKIERNSPYQNPGRDPPLRPDHNEPFHAPTDPRSNPPTRSDGSNSHQAHLPLSGVDER
ncbi:pH-response regulator protein palH/rim21 [Myotisia sp. PD_48]|nr:pH-response regulator protein palH/rim21 [Myotisia sp. PD_48]